MADIFVSFASEDRSRVEPLAKALEDQGWSVWWDRAIPRGKSFDNAIQEAITETKCIIVIWSKQSIRSDWVKKEAATGKLRKILVPAKLDSIELPLAFESNQAANLINWQGDSTDPQFQELISDLSAILGPPPLKANVPEQTRAEAKIGNIFISYSRNDQSYVRELAVYLENEGLSVWVDERIEHGDRWWQTIVANISKCAAMIVVMTPESEKTDWVEREYFYANRIKKPLVPLLLKGDCFPFFVNRQYSDVRDRSMPSKALLDTLRHLVEQADEEHKRKEEEQKRIEASQKAEAKHKQKEPEFKYNADEKQQRKGKGEQKFNSEPDQKETIESSLFKPRKRINALKFGVLAGVALLLLAGMWWYISKPQKFIINSIGMKFALVPAGRFNMGSQLTPEEVADRYGGKSEWFKDEQPQHPAEIAKPFYLMTTEVSQGQWKKVMGDDPSYFKNCGDECPVEQVSWDDAQKLISKLNQMESTNKYRLPTEAEWEYACRAEAETAFSFGDEAAKLGEYGWYADNSEGQTHPGGKKLPNSWGLYDMHGNVYEWCQDWYGDYPSKSAVDPMGPAEGKKRVMRSGSWNDIARDLRSAYRHQGLPGARSKDIGFRVARDF